jgi:hypothetical protein
MLGITPVLKSIKMFDEHVVEIVFNDYIKVTLKGVTEVYEILDKVTEGKKVSKLLIIGKGTEITNAARLGIIEENKKRKGSIISEAIVVNSVAQRVSTNFYMHFIQKVYPTQCFTDVEKARNWIARQGGITASI